MTRWIAWAILFAVWATLIAGGGIAYFLTRAALLSDLDRSIVMLARGLPEVKDRPEYRALEVQPSDAVIFVNDKPGQHPQVKKNFMELDVFPQVRDAQFIAQGSGQRYRQLVLLFAPKQNYLSAITSDLALMPVDVAGAIQQSVDDISDKEVIYNYPADHFDQFMDRLAIALAVFCGVAGVVAALVAVPLSRAALKPLRETAQTIGQIDERRLDRRIDVAALPQELQPVADRLNQMLGRLDLAFAQRKQFLADASHELRTPVAALVTTIEVALRRPRDTAEYVRTLKICLSDARLLRQLVQTLLEHARSEAVPESAEPFDVVAVLNQCADVAEGLAATREVKVVRELPVHLEVHSFPKRIRGIVMNLMGNAVEHNHPGGSVEVQCETRGRDLEITVSDTGPGIAPEHLPYIFQPFYRAKRQEEPEDARQHLGLGLFLVDSHVKALGGECRIESEVGKGTAFHIRVPDAVAAEPQSVEAVV
jgi:signal transduction histidine kinase